MTSSTSKKRAVYRWLLFAATLAALGWFIARNSTDILRHSIPWHGPLFIFAFFAVAAAYLVKFGAWTRLASTMGLSAPLSKAGRAYFLSILGRYIPGKLGLALIRVEAYEGHAPRKVVMATAMELIIALTAALLLALVGLATSPASFPSYLRWAPLVIIIPLLIALSPPLVRRAVNTILRLAGREELDRFPSYRANLLFVLLYTLPGFLHGLGLFFVLNTLCHVPVSHYLTVTGIYYAANFIGVVAIFAPGGLGVREGILFLVLPALVGKENAILAAILIRLITVAAELALASVFAAIARRR